MSAFQDTQSEDILAAGASAASSAPNGKRRKVVQAAKSNESWDANISPLYAKHPQQSGGPMAPPSSSDEGHHQDFHDPNRAKNFSQIDQVNDQMPINRFLSEREWVPIRIAPPLSNSGPLTSSSPSPAMVRVSRTIKSDEGYYTNSQPDAQSCHSRGTWNLNQDQRSIHGRRMLLSSPEPAHLLPEGLRQRRENDQNASFTDGSSTAGEPTLQSLSEHGSPEVSVADDTCEIASNCSLSCDEQWRELPNELLPIRARFEEQIKADYILNWRAFHGHITSRPSQQSTSTSQQQNLETSRSSRPLAPSAKSLWKRRREEDQDPDDVPSSDDGRKRRRATCEADGPENRLFACPYAKFDPTRYSERNEVETSYRGCSSKLLRSIARVKQHLYRVHTRPAQYCPRCGREFERQDLLEAHIRETTTCDVQELPFKEKMIAEQKDAVHRRTPSKHPRKAWFEIFGILFPDARKPKSPYAEPGSPEAIQDFLVYIQERAPQRISELIMQNGSSLEPYVHSMLDDVVETAILGLVQQYGNDFHRLPADNSQHSSDPAPLAEASTAVLALPELLNPGLQHLGAGPSLTDYTGSGSNTAIFDHQRLAEQGTEIPELYHTYSYPADESAYHLNPGSSMYIASGNSNHILQGQMMMPVEVWPPGTLNQSPGRRLQRVGEGA